MEIKRTSPESDFGGKRGKNRSVRTSPKGGENRGTKTSPESVSRGKKSKKQHHIHFIGIGGTAMASLAVAFRQAGFKITGSEPHEIFPPMRDVLKKNKIKYHSPFNAKKMGNPDEVVIGNAHYSENNPEVMEAREKKLELMHFPRLVEKYLIKKNSTVVAGTYGKTSTSAALTWILKNAKKDPSFLVAGAPLNFSVGASLKKSSWSVVEGDEYPAASPWDYSPKFAYYHPKHLILTSAEWDHMDIYKTQKSYVDVFKKMVGAMPKNGLIIAKKNGENLKQVLSVAKCRVVYYNFLKEKQKTDYTLDDIEIKNGKTFFGVYKKNSLVENFETSLIGNFNLENLLASIAMAYELKVPGKTIKQSIKTFKGVKRRLEIRATKKGITIIDDFAHNPSKAKSATEALKKHFPQSDIYIVFEPNRGGRSSKCLNKYRNSFVGAKKVIIPKLSNYKAKAGVIDANNQQIKDSIKAGGVSAVAINDYEKILNKLRKEAKKGDVIAFMGSRNFGGMIEKLIESL